jgi:protein-L-isoaspartate(D-aspartate) O-methyltransferase
LVNSEFRAWENGWEPDSSYECRYNLVRAIFGTRKECSLDQAIERMIERQLVARGIRDDGVLDAMRRVPRAEFVDDSLKQFAYQDRPLPIGEGQTISQPYIVALMLEAAEIRPDNRVLDVGAGSGYASAVAAQLAAEVYAIERHRSLVERAEVRFLALGYRNIVLRQGDGTARWPGAEKFDVILVAAAGSHVPAALKAQLKIGGRLIIPLGDPNQMQELVKFTKLSEVDFEEMRLGPVRFVPLIGSDAKG